EAGRVELDAPVQRYLPWFRVVDPHASVQMTVRHLLNQTSGLPTSAGWIPLADFDESPFAAERQARALSTLKLTRPVGSAHEYSNMNYNLLGLIIEAASAKSYEAYIENHIFIPLEMCHSYTKKAAAKQNGLAMGHRFWFSRPIPTADLPLPRGSQASGQLISCAEDMAHYLIFHLNGGRYGNVQIISPAGIAELHRPAAPVSFMGASLGHYGMGWYCEEHNQTKILWHSGIVPDFASYMALFPEQKKGLVLLINADHFMMNPVITEIGSGLASLLAEKQPSPLKFGFLFMSMPALLLIPLLQVVGVIATLRQLRRWRQDPNSRPSRERLWGQHILLPLIPNLAFVAIPLWMLASRMLGFMLLFLQDFTLIALICGGFAGMWAFLRTGLILRFMRKSQTPISIR
ncbi:MAG TPA: serine hydrolase domain-containing protein, partial [Anaerolineaceae bacterium]|nr:serine hydrolase domain-containing protein [Anaerolineaceae bacterium]